MSFLQCKTPFGERHSEIFREIIRKMLLELLESIQVALNYISEKLNALRRAILVGGKTRRFFFSERSVKGFGSLVFLYDRRRTTNQRIKANRMLSGRVELEEPLSPAMVKHPGSPSWQSWHRGIVV